MTTQVATLLSPDPHAVLDASHHPGDAEVGLFTFLDHSHQEMQRMLASLRELVRAIDADELTPAVRARAREILDWFNTQARQHHLDEERHVFPALLASPDAEVSAVAQRLVQDHGWLEEDWIEIAPALASAADGYQWFDLDVLRHSVEVFDQLYVDHILLEESLAYPEARALIPASDLQAMGLEMARRRALREHAGNR